MWRGQVIFSSFLSRPKKRTGSSLLAEGYQLRAAHLRAEATAPDNLKRRSLLFFAAWEYELLAGRMIEAAKVERTKMTEARTADRRRRQHAGVHYGRRSEIALKRTGRDGIH